MTSEAIKKIGKAVFLSKKTFSKKLGISFVTVSRWKTGKAKTAYKIMKLID